MRLINRIFGGSILLASAFLFAFAFVHSAEAQQWNSMDFGDGWTRHSFSDGTTGYSTHMGDGWYRHSFSDGTTGYSQPLPDPYKQRDWQKPDYAPYRQKDWRY